MAPAWHSTAIRSVWNFDCFRFAAQVRPGAKGPPPPPPHTHTHTHARTQQNAAKQLRLSARTRQTRLLPPHRSAGYLRVKRIPASVRQTLESGRSFRCCSSPGARVLAAETGTPGLFRSNSVVARAWHSRQCRSLQQTADHRFQQTTHPSHVKDTERRCCGKDVWELGKMGASTTFTQVVRPPILQETNKHTEVAPLCLTNSGVKTRLD